MCGVCLAPQEKDSLLVHSSAEEGIEEEEEGVEAQVGRGGQVH